MFCRLSEKIPLMLDISDVIFLRILNFDFVLNSPIAIYKVKQLHRHFKQFISFDRMQVEIEFNFFAALLYA